MAVRRDGNGSKEGRAYLLPLGEGSGGCAHRYHCNRAPIRMTRGAVMTVGRSHELPEAVVSACSALLLNRLYTSKNPMTRTALMRNVFSVRTSAMVTLGVRLAAIGSALIVAFP